MTSTTSAATTTTVDPRARTLTVVRRFAADADRVWTGWTQPAALARWWGPTGWITTVHELDLRPGGRWRYTLRPADGSGDPVHGVAVYDEVVVRQRLAYRDATADDAGRPLRPGTPVQVDFSVDGAGTRVALCATFPSAEELDEMVTLGMVSGYRETFDRLAELVEPVGTAGSPGAPTPDPGATSTVTSADGTAIAYEQRGTGPVIVVVNTTAEDRTSLAGVAGLLAAQHTVVSYDRRGRGESGDTAPYAPEREVEDLAAVIDRVGGSAALISGSAGCVLCLDAATALGDAVTALHLYEPPFIVDDSRPPMPPDYVERVEELIADDDRDGAATYFLTVGLQIPAEYLAMMRADPSWAQMCRYAHTLAYDGRIVAGTQDGTPLPRDRWRVEVPVLIMVGATSEPFFHTGAAALADLLPRAAVETLPGQDHAAFWLAPEAVVAAVTAFRAPS